MGLGLAAETKDRFQCGELTEPAIASWQDETYANPLSVAAASSPMGTVVLNSILLLNSKLVFV